MPFQKFWDLPESRIIDNGTIRVKEELILEDGATLHSAGFEPDGQGVMIRWDGTAEFNGSVSLNGTITTDEASGEYLEITGDNILFYASSATGGPGEIKTSDTGTGAPKIIITAPAGGGTPDTGEIIVGEDYLAIATGIDAQITLDPTTTPEQIRFENFDGDVVALFEDGAAGTPSISFNDDTDTGIFRAGSDALRFAAGGTAQVEVNTTRVDIGLNTDRSRIGRKTSTGDPSSPLFGDVYVNSTDRVMKVYSNGAWRTIASW